MLLYCHVSLNPFYRRIIKKDQLLVYSHSI